MRHCCTQSFHRPACSPSEGWHVQSVQPSSTQARPLRSKRQRMGAEWRTGGNLAGCLGKIWETPSHCQNMLRHRPAIITHTEGFKMTSFKMSLSVFVVLKGYFFFKNVVNPAFQNLNTQTLEGHFFAALEVIDSH